jgi:tRNA (adenine37-N6)-methyltransferase
MNKIIYRPIGILHSPFKTIENIPIQNIGAKGEKGTIEIFREYADGLKYLKGFSHIILLYHLHKVKYFSLLVKPFMDVVEHGIFATRSPVRPNPIGLTLVNLLDIKDNLLLIENIDMIDQTPLLDIKPYLPQIDDNNDVRIGWLTRRIDQIELMKSDNRFKK